MTLFFLGLQERMANRMQRIIIRAVRKTAHITNRVLGRTLSFTGRVENKSSRLLNGLDYTVQIDESIHLEKIYYNSIPHVTPLNPALPAVGQKASVVLFIPSLDDKSFYGGTATALIVAAKMALLQERPLRIVQTLKNGKVESLSKFYKSEGITISDDIISIIDVSSRAYNVYGYIPINPKDIFIASAWWDAYLIGQLPITNKFIYLIQDFEPIFYNNSDLYILAESTYKKNNYIPLCNTKLMYDFMSDRKYPPFNEKQASWFEPAVSRNKSGLATKKQNNSKKIMFIYGRPDVHRNLFFTGLSAVDYALKANFIKPDEWEFFMAGQDNIPDIILTSGAKINNLGKMTMEEYIIFSKKVDLAVSLMMAPHPNYPTLEFASIGSAVVTTKYANKQNLKGYCKNIVASDIDVESIAGAIKIAAKISYDMRIHNLTESKIPTAWDTALDKPIGHIANYF